MHHPTWEGKETDGGKVMRGSSCVGNLLDRNTGVVADLPAPVARPDVVKSTTSCGHGSLMEMEGLVSCGRSKEATFIPVPESAVVWTRQPHWWLWM